MLLLFDKIMIMNTLNFNYLEILFLKTLFLVAQVSKLAIYVSNRKGKKKRKRERERDREIDM